MCSPQKVQLKQKIGDYSTKESSKKIAPSIQTLIEKFRFVVLRRMIWKIELLIELQPLLVNQVSNSNVEKKILVN